ncbi:hypothetical protein [Streptomyces roseolus]|uniref:hypothetical protein n=1 Tax=Streptomyces roseolus TaxID=67358 RepID=UPI001999C500|nr:hypothetical protein [Streptomyces roseolus]GGR53946.1 hypothetical protein GCM10010282_53780 [Streptomyces roseolus]
MTASDTPVAYVVPESQAPGADTLRPSRSAAGAPIFQATFPSVLGRVGDGDADADVGALEADGGTEPFPESSRVPEPPVAHTRPPATTASATAAAPTSTAGRRHPRRGDGPGGCDGGGGGNGGGYEP